MLFFCTSFKPESQQQNVKLFLREPLVLVFIITVTYAPSAAASDARSEAAGDAGTSSRPSDNADEAAPPAPEGLAGSDSSKR